MSESGLYLKNSKEPPKKSRMEGAPRGTARVGSG